MDKFSEVQTAKASEYVASLCKHFGRRVSAKQEGRSAHIAFPFGACDLTAEAVCLRLAAHADSPEALAKTVEVVSGHLERFAFRENPEINWQYEPSSHVASAPGRPDTSPQPNSPAIALDLDSQLEGTR